ncbi:MAG: TAT-variant-translocated molybdopterin oxidoreductase [Armatimonadetes bacterium]|nr:TAT-variant-translocated molybdopterin oxidoreductase [Armatimonadota bacterium]
MDSNNLPNPPQLDLDAVREKLNGKTGRHYWRSLEEVAETPEFQQWVDDEFPNRRSLVDMDRRVFLKFMGASIALAGLTGCRGYFLPEEKIVPYVKNPEEVTIGKPLYYASTFVHAGYGHGVLVSQNEGRPTKIEGNPDHPSSKGTSSIFMQAAMLTMYDPDRSQEVMAGRGDDATADSYQAFFRELKGKLKATQAAQGAGFRVLVESITSPTILEQLAELKKAYPAMTVHAWEPFGRRNVYEGTRVAFGKPLNPIYDLSKAKVIVSLDADFLADGPGALMNARGFAAGRKAASEGTMNRLYAFESGASITGAVADHRWGIRPSAILDAAKSILNGIENGSASPVQGVEQRHLQAMVKDLMAAGSAGVVVAGDYADPEVHIVVAHINEKLASNALSYTEAFDTEATSASINDLVKALNANKVDVLAIVGSNPVFTAPSDLEFEKALGKAKFSVHYGLYRDETARACDWHVPATSFLEEWGDARAIDGTVSIIQPLIKPLYNNPTPVEFFGALQGDLINGHERIRKTKYAGAVADENGWRKVLHDGVVPNTKLPVVKPTAQQIAVESKPVTGIEISFRPDPHIFDGRYANNGWLQELPRPMSKLTWDNAAIVSPKTAAELGVKSEESLTITVGGNSATLGVYVQPGQPDGVITLHAGFGRTEGGTVQKNAGVDVYALRSSKALNHAVAEETRGSSAVYALATTQIHHSMLGRDIVQWNTLAELSGLTGETAHGAGEHKEGEHKEGEHGAEEGHKRELKDLNMYPDEIFEFEGPQWGMTIDMNLCIGCNACAIACQAENNIPIVGKEQVKRGREMHWIRIDRYYTSQNAVTGQRTEEPNNKEVDPIDNPMPVFQPIACVHCEKAPCEPVCPVAATVHSHDGLNQMVYNRCVGTRYCSNNCPYKVRRFNYLNYSDNQPQFSEASVDIKQVPGPIKSPKTNGIQLLQMLVNPDVSVRGRGVMEKCTYCTQRISGARIEAKKLGRELQDGEVVTACQQACPTQAIVFGNIRDKDSKVFKSRRDKRAYLLLNEELQTRPRTSHLSKVMNPNPEIKA